MWILLMIAYFAMGIKVALDFNKTDDPALDCPVNRAGLFIIHIVLGPIVWLIESPTLNLFSRIGKYLEKISK